MKKILRNKEQCQNCGKKLIIKGGHLSKDITTYVPIGKKVVELCPECAKGVILK